MKKLSKLFILTIFLSIFISSPTFAATPKTIAKPQPQPQTIMLADLNVLDANIISQQGNIFKISFSIKNGLGIQTGVKYGVKLVSTSAKGQVVEDEMIYPESLTVYENSTIQREITYTAPQLLNGKYTIYLTSRNENGFPFSTNYVKEVELTSSTKGVQILNESCSLSVPGEKGSPSYKLNQLVDIATTESLSLTCLAINNSKAEVVVTPAFITNNGTVYGNLVVTDTGDAKPISFKAGEKKSFTIVLPKASVPGIYYLTAKLKQGELFSNQVDLTYLIRGEVTKIMNVFLDKDYYRKGDTADLSYMTSTFDGKYLRGSMTTTALSIVASITDYKGKECATPTTQPLVYDSVKPKKDMPLSITRDCRNPVVAVSVKDASGNTLDQKNFKAETISVKPSSPLMTIILIIIIIIIIAGIYLYKKRKNSTPSTPKSDESVKITNTIAVKIVLPFLMLLSFSLIPAHQAKASTFTVTGMSACNPVIDITLQYSQYWAGQNIKGTSSITTNCSGTNNYSISMTTDPASITYPSAYIGITNSYTQPMYTSPGITGTANITQAQYGPYTMYFVAKWSNSNSNGGFAYYGTGSITYTGKTDTMGIGVSAANGTSYNSYISGEPIQVIWSRNPTFDLNGPTLVSCTASPGTNNTTATSGSFTTALATTTTYNISCLNSFGYYALGSKTVTIQPVTITAALVAAPYTSSSLTLKTNEGQSTQVSWTVPASATSCTCTVVSANSKINGTSCRQNGDTTGLGAGGSDLGKIYSGLDMTPSATFNVQCGN